MNQPILTFAYIFQMGWLKPPTSDGFHGMTFQRIRDMPGMPRLKEPGDTRVPCTRK